MNSQLTDLTFFTNNHNQTLLDRFKTTLSDARLFDVLVGYFRSSGFYQLYDSIEPVEKNRILVALVYELKVAGKAIFLPLGELKAINPKMSVEVVSIIREALKR